MNLTINKRVGETKGATKQLRRKGKIPAVLYSPGNPGLPIELEVAEFEAVMRKIRSNHLSTTIFTLNIDGKQKKAIVKEIQYDRTTYQVIHLDFAELHDDVPVSVKIPIECIGVAECVGIKLGGSLRHVIRNVKVKCLPKDIPSEFALNVKDLKIRQSKRMSDIAMPKGVKPVVATDEVVLVIAKR